MASFSQGWFYIHNAILKEVALFEQTTGELDWEDPRFGAARREVFHVLPQGPGDA